MSDDRWTQFIRTSYPSDDACEGPDSPPTHTVRLTLDVEVDVIVPTWVNPHSAFVEVCAALDSAALSDAISENGTYADPELLWPDVRVLGATGRVERWSAR